MVDTRTESSLCQPVKWTKPLEGAGAWASLATVCMDGRDWLEFGRDDAGEVREDAHN